MSTDENQHQQAVKKLQMEIVELSTAIKCLLEIICGSLQDYSFLSGEDFDDVYRKVLLWYDDIDHSNPTIDDLKGFCNFAGHVIHEIMIFIVDCDLDDPKLIDDVKRAENLIRKFQCTIPWLALRDVLSTSQ